MIRFDVPEILRFYDFVDLAGKNVFARANLCILGIFTSYNCDNIVLTPKICSSHEGMRFDILLVKIGSGVSLCRLVKFGY